MLSAQRSNRRSHSPSHTRRRILRVTEAMRIFIFITFYALGLLTYITYIGVDRWPSDFKSQKEKIANLISHLRPSGGDGAIGLMTRICSPSFSANCRHTKRT